MDPACCTRSFGAWAFHKRVLYCKKVIPSHIRRYDSKNNVYFADLTSVWHHLVFGLASACRGVLLRQDRVRQSVPSCNSNWQILELPGPGSARNAVSNARCDLSKRWLACRTYILFSCCGGRAKAQPMLWLLRYRGALIRRQGCEA